MPIEVPGKRWGKRLRKSRVFGHQGQGKANIFADLLITPLVDMFVIIVLFLIANFSATGEILNMSKDIQLPEAANVKEIEMAPVVMVSNEQLLVNSTPIASVSELMRDDGGDLSVRPLEEKLREMKKQFEDLHALAKDNQSSFKGDVNIQGNREVPFKVMKRVLYSCAVAGYSNINFAVLTQGGVKDGEGSAPTAAGRP